MIIQRFVGTNVKDVQKEVARELGPDAVVISTRYFQKGFFSRLFGKYFVEVVAVIDHVEKQSKEVKKLKKLQEIAEDLDLLKEKKRQAQKVINPKPLILDPKKQNIIAFVGIQGAGKTTVCLKLALHLKHDPHFKVGLISLMERGKGGAQQLAVHARKHDLLHCYARNPEELGAALASFSKCNVIFIDADVDPRVDVFAGCLKEVPDVQVELVLSGTSSHKQVNQNILRYQDFSLCSVIITRCEMDINLAEILELLGQKGISVSYLSASPEISCGLEEVGPLARA